MTVKGIDYVKSAERWQEYGRDYHKDASIYYAEGIKALLTVATFLVGFIGVILQLGNLLNGPMYGKILIAISLISSLISAISGILLLRKTNEFFNKAGDYYEKLSESLFIWLFKNKTEFGNEYPKEIYTGNQLKPELKNILSDIQLGSIIIAFISIIVYFFIFLFGRGVNIKLSKSIDLVKVKNEVTVKSVKTIIKSSSQKNKSLNNNIYLSANPSFTNFNKAMQKVVGVIKKMMEIFFSGFIGAMIALWLNKINNPKLDIIATESANIEIDYGSEKPVPGKCKFFRLKVVNKPLNKYLSIFFSRETAQQLNAFITFRELGKTMKGRWSETLELAYTDNYNRIRLANFPEPISLYPGDNKILDVFAKFESYDHAYGWNNEAYLDNNLWKTETYKLNPGDYSIEVIIAGTNATIKKTFTIHIDEVINKTTLT